MSSVVGGRKVEPRNRGVDGRSGDGNGDVGSVAKEYRGGASEGASKINSLALLSASSRATTISFRVDVYRSAPKSNGAACQLLDA